MTDTQELIKELEALKPGGDVESTHVEAESLLLTWLDKNGYNNVSDAYRAAKDRVGFWYA